MFFLGLIIYSQFQGPIYFSSIINKVYQFEEEGPKTKRRPEQTSSIRPLDNEASDTSINNNLEVTTTQVSDKQMRKDDIKSAVIEEIKRS